VANGIEHILHESTLSLSNAFFVGELVLVDVKEDGENVIGGSAMKASNEWKHRSEGKELVLTGMKHLVEIRERQVE